MDHGSQLMLQDVGTLLDNGKDLQGTLLLRPCIPIKLQLKLECNDDFRLLTRQLDSLFPEQEICSMTAQQYWRWQCLLAPLTTHALVASAILRITSQTSLANSST